MQYQVLLDPATVRLPLTVPTVIQQLSVNNSNAGGGFYPQGDQFYYVRGLGLVQNTADMATSWWARKTALRYAFETSERSP